MISRKDNKLAKTVFKTGKENENSYNININIVIPL